ncbi:MAG: TonB-dependent receptor [Bacteroidaceae bacterium]|nr:TonB-dependent receptor [Bacteroidaceae bacterium]
MKKQLVILGMGMLSWTATYAQQQDTTLVRTVVVENEYNPTVMDASKINILPKVEEPTVPKALIDYAGSICPVSTWNYQAMQPIVKDWKVDAAYRGYLRAGYGNNGNVDARLGYLWDISKKDRLNLAASFGGWNGDLASLYDQDWNSRLYNTKVDLDYRHTFNKVDFLLGGSYRSQVFNFVNSDTVEDENFDEEADLGYNKQHQTFADVHIGFASNDKNMAIQFQAEAGWKSFKEKYPVMHHDEANKETNLYVMADVWKQTQNDSRFGLKVRFDNYAYSGEWVDDRIALEFNPYYSLQNDDWKVRLGVHIDWVGMEEEDDKVYFAPDVNVEYTFSDSYVFFAKAGGGRQTSSLYELAMMTPYFYEYQLKPTYATLDAALGLKASPANGWWFLLSGGYQIRENDVCWSLGYPYWSARNFNGNTKAFYATGELKHNYKDLFDFALRATYYHWDWKNTDWIGGDLTDLSLSLKPELEVNAEVGFKPIEGLKVNLGYEYVKRCNDMGGDPVSNLYVGADYALLKNLSVFAKFNNLLNKEYVASYAYPAQKLNFLAGLSLQF